MTNEEKNIMALQIPVADVPAFEKTINDNNLFVPKIEDWSGENFAFYDTSKLTRQQLYIVGRLVTINKF